MKTETKIRFVPSSFRFFPDNALNNLNVWNYLNA